MERTPRETDAPAPATESAPVCDRRALVGWAALACGGAALALSGCAAGSGREGVAAPGAGGTADDAPGGPGRPSQGASASARPDPAEPADSLDLRVERALSSLTLEQKVCQLFFLRPEALTGVGQVTQAAEATQAALDAYPVGGLIYFSQNILDADQFRSLIADTASMRVPVPLFLGIDEEGGPLVARIANSGAFDVPSYPNMSEIGAGGDASAAREAGASIGGYLADLGLDVDFAPVCDVLTNPGSAIGARAFSGDAHVAAEMAAQVVLGLQGAGVHACAKHFPGHGDAAADSHTGAAVSERTLDDLRACEFVPFKAAIDAGVSFVMVGHISTPNAAADGLPASLSRVAITDWLRGELGFDGIVTTDAMNMGAVTQGWTSDAAAVAFLTAGGDIVLDPDDFALAYQGLLDAVHEGVLSEARIDESVRRILRVKLA